MTIHIGLFFTWPDPKNRIMTNYIKSKSINQPTELTVGTKVSFLYPHQETSKKNSIEVEVA